MSEYVYHIILYIHLNTKPSEVSLNLNELRTAYSKEIILI